MILLYEGASVHHWDGEQLTRINNFAAALSEHIKNTDIDAFFSGF